MFIHLYVGIGFYYSQNPLDHPVAKDEVKLKQVLR